MPPELQAAGFGDETVDPIPWSSQESGFGMPASPVPLPPPALEPIGQEVDDDGRRHVRARARSPRGAPMLQLVFAEDSAPISVSIEGGDSR